MKKISIAALLAVSTLYIGCGGGGGMAASYNVMQTTASVVASDAYVVKLNSPAVAVCGDQNFTTTEVKDGNITFNNIPSNVDLSSCTFIIPNDAIVDTDGDGNYSAADLPIRMGLKIKGEGVANPLTTVAVENNDTTALEQARNFDPVKAKETLLEDVNNTKYQALVALSDTIADLIKTAKEENVSSEEIIKNININDALNQIDQNNTDINVTELVQNTIIPAVSGTPIDQNATQIIEKTQQTIQLLQQLHTCVKDGKIDKKQALTLVIAHSDADVNVSVEENMTATELQNIQSTVLTTLQEKHHEEIQCNNVVDCYEELLLDHKEDNDTTFTSFTETNSTNTSSSLDQTTMPISNIEDNSTDENTSIISQQDNITIVPHIEDNTTESEETNITIINSDAITDIHEDHTITDSNITDPLPVINETENNNTTVSETNTTQNDHTASTSESNETDTNTTTTLNDTNTSTEENSTLATQESNETLPTQLQ